MHQQFLATKQKACQRCAEAKRACDNKYPICGRCARHQLQCRYITLQQPRRAIYSRLLLLNHCQSMSPGRRLTACRYNEHGTRLDLQRVFMGRPMSLRSKGESLFAQRSVLICRTSASSYAALPRWTVLSDTRGRPGRTIDRPLRPSYR